ncbi:hypothetical protein J3E68DRAFT_389626 [Trichoderma sp. SZMC 28012]
MNPELTRILARIRGTLMALSPGRVDWSAGAGDGEMRDCQQGGIAASREHKASMVLLLVVFYYISSAVGTSLET